MASPVRSKRELLDSAPRPAKKRCGQLDTQPDAEQQSTYDSDCDFSMVENSMFEEEPMFMPAHDYMSRQRYVTSKMREFMINSLVDIHNRFQLKWTTLFLAANFFDRYLARSCDVSESELQLVAITSLIVASKFEEVNPPDVQAFLNCASRRYAPEDVSRLECLFLKTLDFRLACSTGANFLERLRGPNNIDEMQYCMVRYFVEVTASKIQFLSFSPSQIAAAAVLLSNRVMKRHSAWPEEMASIARYSESSLESCASELLSCVEAAQTDPLNASCRKYRTTKHYGSWSVKVEEFQRTRHMSTSPVKANVSLIVLEDSPPKHSPPPKQGAISTASVSMGGKCLMKCSSVERLCGLRKCPENRINLHKQAFEGICKNSNKKLKDMCKARRVACSGNKEELALRLIDVMFH